MKWQRLGTTPYADSALMTAEIHSLPFRVCGDQCINGKPHPEPFLKGTVPLYVFFDLLQFIPLFRFGSPQSPPGTSHHRFPCPRLRRRPEWPHLRACRWLQGEQNNFLLFRWLADVSCCDEDPRRLYLTQSRENSQDRSDIPRH